MSSNGYEQGNYVRAVNVAGRIVAAADTGDLTAKEVAFNVLELAKELAKGQDKYFKKNGFEGNSYTQSSGKRSGGSGQQGSSAGGLTPKQRAALNKAFKALGDSAPYTMEEIEAFTDTKERSDAIGEVFDAAWPS